jgi:hypothetical protein
MIPQPDPSIDGAAGGTATNGRSIAQIAAADDIDLDLGELFDVLSSPRRRYVLATLQHCAEPTTLDELAADVSAWELECDPSDVPQGRDEPIRVSLYHAHVPKMVDAGLLEYRGDRTTVCATDAALKLRDLEHLPRL